MREDIDLKVHLAFDDEAGVWYVAESDIPGLRLEASDPMELVKRIGEAAAEMIELNLGEIVAVQGSKAPRRVGFTPIFDNAFPVTAAA